MNANLEKNRENLEEQEISEIQQINKELKKYRRYPHSIDYTYKSSEMGGHMELRKISNLNSISPSLEEVEELLKSCGKKLGINYVGR